MKANIDFFKIETNDIKPRKGRILIAEPFLYDFYFKTAIVLITEHNDKGTVGFILNKPMKASMQEIIPELSGKNFSVSLGGPVNTDSLHFLHTLGEQIPGSVQVFDKVYWGGDFEILKKLIEEGRVNENHVRFFLGYSGWDARQLDKELKENSWLVTNIDSRSIMNTRPDTIWRDVLGRLGPKYKMWINSPEDPSLN